jgi:hypothetical protein
LDTKTFLTRVTAQQDELVISTHRPDASGNSPRGIFWNRGSFSDLDSAVQAIEQWDLETHTTVYFSVGNHAGHSYVDPITQRTKYRRKQETATWFKALALDLDVGADKPYTTQAQGWGALRPAIAALGLPMPMVVSSGNGIHCYWPLTTPVSAAHWVKASVALRVALADKGVSIDTSKIHDPSMVLRPVGTHHKKQTPWKLVECKLDCPDYEPLELFSALKPWVGASPAQSRAVRPAGHIQQRSSIASAVLGSGDIVLAPVLTRCHQLAAIAASGGVTDADGNRVEEPLWRATLGFAKYCTDPEAAVIQLAGGHPDFDLQQNLDKMMAWQGTGPTTCAKFEQLCPGGCQGCPSRGSVTSPAGLSFVQEVQVPPEVSGVADEEITLPPGYAVLGGKMTREVMTEGGVDGNGTLVVIPKQEVFCNYIILVTGVYTDAESSAATCTLAVKYPNDGWKQFDAPVSILSVPGKEFAAFLMGKLIFAFTLTEQENIRRYLVRYLEMVQAESPTGADFVTFGWQADGSFLCGERLLGSPTGNQDRRLKGPAARYSNILKPHGERDKWVQAMDMLSEKGAENIASAVLVATSGVLGPVAGNASFIMSIYSHHTTTGKSLALMAANSLIGSPRELMLGERDTANAVYKVRGVLNNLPATMDEMTMQDEEAAVSLAYNLSMGREKLAMTKDRDVRDPVTWEGPTIITANNSLHAKFDEYMQQSDPVRARTLELAQHDRTFIGGKDGARGTVFYNLVQENNGWAMPELVEAVIAMGGPKAVWEKGLAAFEKSIRFNFQPQERFYRTAIISSWIMGKIGERLGLFPFNVDKVTEHLCDTVKDYRRKQEETLTDVFDIIGQFLQEHNDQIIEAREQYHSTAARAEAVQFPVPDKAVARIKLVYDDKTPVMPGSAIMINVVALKKWLSRRRDSLTRVNDELLMQGALISPRQRITMFKGCQRNNPGQAPCVIINANHPRFADALTSTKSRVSTVSLQVLKGGGNA